MPSTKPRREYSLTSSSAIAFAVPYEDCGRSTLSSGTTSGRSSPNTATVLENTKRGARREPAAGLQQVPRSVDVDAHPEYRTRPQTVRSGRPPGETRARRRSSTMDRTNAGSAIVPTRARRRAGPRWGTQTMSAATMRDTGAPLPPARSALMTRLPRNPAAPVTSTFIVSSLSAAIRVIRGFRRSV